MTNVQSKPSSNSPEKIQFQNSKNQTQIILFSNRQYALIRKELHNFKQVIYPSFKLLNRQLKMLRDRSYLINEFDRQIGMPLKEYLKVCSLSFDTLRLITLSILRFRQFLQSLNLNFSQRMAQSIYIKQSTDKSVQVYFTSIDFTFDIYQKKFQGKNINDRRKQTKMFAENFRQIEISRKYRCQFDLLFHQMLEKCHAGGFRSAAEEYRVYQLTDTFINGSLLAALKQLQCSSIQLPNHILNFKLTRAETHTDDNRLKISIKDIQTQKTLFNQIKEPELKDLNQDYRTLQQLFCELSAANSQQITLNSNFQLVLTQKQNAKVLKFVTKFQNQQSEDFDLGDAQNFEIEYQSLEVENENAQDETKKQYPYDCIGSVISNLEYKTYAHTLNETSVHTGNKIFVGTGIVIAPNLILTCAHNVCQRKDEETKQFVKREAKEVFFKITNEGQVRKIKAQRWIVSQRFYLKQDLKSRLNDYAILILEQTIERQAYFKIAKNYRTRNSIHVQGMVSMNNSECSKQERSQIVQTDQNLIEYNLKTWNGDSGSPVFVQLCTNHYYIIGVHTSRLTFKDGSWKGSAIRITSEIISRIIQLEKSLKADSYVEKKSIEYEPIEKSIGIFKDSNLDSFNYLIRIVYEPQIALCANLSENTQVEHIPEKYAPLRWLAARIIATKPPSIPDKPNQVTLFVLVMKIYEIFSRCQTSKGNLLLSDQAYHLLARNLSVDQTLKIALRQLTSVLLEQPELMWIVFKKQKEFLYQTIWMQRTNPKYVFDPINIFVAATDHHLNMVKELLPQWLASMIIHLAISGKIIGQNQKYSPTLSRVGYFQKIKGIITFCYLIFKQDWLCELSLLVNLWQNQQNKVSITAKRIETFVNVIFMHSLDLRNTLEKSEFGMM